MQLHRALTLLLLLGIIWILDARKLEKILKKVGRRYDQRVRDVFFPMNPDSPDEHSHNRTAKLVATVLQGQGSVKNEKVEWSGIVLSELIRADKFKGGICGDKDMNYCRLIGRGEGRKREEMKMIYRPIHQLLEESEEELLEK